MYCRIRSLAWANAASAVRYGSVSWHAVEGHTGGQEDLPGRSMRTSAKSVGEGRWARSNVAGGQWPPHRVARGAVLDCCTRFGDERPSTTEDHQAPRTATRSLAEIRGQSLAGLLTPEARGRFANLSSPTRFPSHYTPRGWSPRRENPGPLRPVAGRGCCRAVAWVCVSVRAWRARVGAGCP